MGTVLVYWLRGTVATAFLLSAAWKIRNKPAFLLVLRSVAPSGSLRPLQQLVPLGETAIAAALLSPGRVGGMAAIAAAGAVSLLSLTLLRQDMTAGCGCWRAAGENRTPLLVRNALLGGLALASLSAPVNVTWTVALAALSAGALGGFMLMELPNLIAFAVSSRRLS